MISKPEVLDVREPPGKAMGKVAELWKPIEGTNKIMCTACARYCKIGEGQVGLCGIRGVHEGKLWLYVYGRVITGHVDPIEKKPVSHYRPGSKIFSIATTGCNWLCNPAGSEILMADGDRRVVEEIRPGDALWSIDEATLRPTPGIVTGVGHRRARTFRVSVYGMSEPVLATGEHPVLTSSGWCDIANLWPGAVVLVSAGIVGSAFDQTNPARISPHALRFHPESVAALQKVAGGEDVETPALEWRAVRSIQPQGPPEPVYGFECIPSHTYLCNGVTLHNCRYCQNADISQRRKVEGIEVEPQDVVRMTLEQGCQGLAYTYNQPTIFIEFARDIGMRARQAGLINIFVSNGYDTPETVAEMPKFLDCVTVDFKGSGETNFVRKYINIPNADPIFQTLLDTRDTKKIHIEITDLIVPQVGDDLGAARHLSRWVHDNLGPDTPIHFLRFHPDYKMMEFPWTPVETLEKHCAVAKEAGLKYVYIGNVPGHPLENTYCPGCGAIAIKRYGFDTTGWYLDKDNKCKKCGYKLAIFGRLEQTAKENRFYSVLYHR